PQAGRRLRGSLVRLRATLFHAGLTSTPPRLRRPNTGRASAIPWARVAPRVAQTTQRYLAQIELGLRPSTVRIAEQALRELATYLAREAPEVNCIADIGRHHIEAYKTWLSTRPRAGGGTLHRHTIRGHLSTPRCFFERITEWDYPGRSATPAALRR
ncbi:MAG: tyrosine-type recombinase/integrase, partial [Pseudonocardiaceae bacterium]